MRTSDAGLAPKVYGPARLAVLQGIDRLRILAHHEVAQRWRQRWEQIKYQLLCHGVI